MQLHLNQLQSHLKNNRLLPVYLVSGDVPLLVQETRDAIYATAQHAGYQQRELFTIETGFNWNTFTSMAENLSLFSEKTLLEIRNPTAKFDTAGANALMDYLENPPTDKILLIVTSKLTSAQQKTRWYKAIDKAGATITIWPIAVRELPNWIATRLQQANLQANADSIRLLAELTEGNLLSAQQAIEKLRLLYPNTLITAKEVAEVISDNARFNIFDLTNYALLGVQKRVIRILSGLQFSGTETTLVLWAITRELRELYSMTMQLEQGQSITQVIASQWQTRKPLLKNALTRLHSNQLNQMLQHAEHIDYIIKGIKVGRAWEELETLCLTLSGATIKERSIG